MDFLGFNKTFDKVEEIPKTYFHNKQTIEGEVSKVVDGDTLRIRHIPKSIFSSGKPKPFTGAPKDHTLPIRIYAVDAPETAKFGKPGQAFADDATRFAEDLLLKKKVSVKLLSKDQYNRIIGVVTYKPPNCCLCIPSKPVDLSEELLKRGLATVYRQGGGQYDGSMERWDNIEVAAKKAKKGMWSLDQASLELPSDYKRKQKKAS